MATLPDDRWLLVCDVDGTLLLPERENPGLEEFNRFIESNRGRIVFAINTGRSLDEVATVAEAGPIVTPEWLACGVGTSLYSGFTPDTADSGWERALSREWNREEIRAALSGCPGIFEQEAWNQHGARLSYYIQGPVPEILPGVLARVEPWKDSIKRVVALDYYLDFMPLWAGKGGAAAYLAEKLGIPSERVLVAGDSGNDRDMLEREFRPIVVANHASDLDDFVECPGVFRSRSPAAAGVLEGLAHFGALSADATAR